MKYEVTVAIDAPPAAVWAVLSDVERWPEWTDSVRSVELLGAPLAVGSRVRIRQPNFPTVTWEVTDLDHGRSFTWRSRTIGSSAIGRHHLADNGDGTVSATLAIEQAGPLGSVVGLLSRRVTKRYVALEAEGLKRRSEQSAGHPR